ncbi:hypothetical protein GCM10027594_03260 [Hymenobacter agri]
MFTKPCSLAPAIIPAKHCAAKKAPLNGRGSLVDLLVAFAMRPGYWLVAHTGELRPELPDFAFEL